MFNRLQQRWKVNGWRLFLIICTFAIGGSLCGYAARRIMPALGIEQPVLWTIVYILLVTILWPLCVLILSIPLGQFQFFRQYLRNMGSRMGMGKRTSAKIRIAIFASGTGTNAARIIAFSQKAEAVFTVSLIVCNKPGAGVLKIAEAHGIPVLLIEKEIFFRGDAYVPQLKAAGIDFVLLAGFLWKIPFALVNAYKNAIINIHPALLPKYGGKGMYGHFVHEAVIANGEAESGITIHWVDEQYDHGSTVFQATCPVLPTDTAESLAARIHQLEHQHFPVVIQQLMKGRLAGK